ncbi:MAG: M20/M25/M40 family metallo-hydrolase [Planctomycetia bacterium]|nr:M20/M25/M40 family metallo-hydrolase [Planctomycetia bacterium]
MPTVTAVACHATMQPRSRSDAPALLIAVASLVTANPSAAAERTVAVARESIRAAEAGRHVTALADDSFEGREGGSRGGRAAGAYVVGAIEKLGLEPAGDDGSFYQRFGGMRNILALLPGSDPTVEHEMVVVGAHYDHVGYGNAANSYGPTGFIHNGADDNASGVAGLIEVMEACQHLPARPRRPILFAFWDGEEKGLLGSYHFLRVRPRPLEKRSIVFSLNLDMIGRLRGERLEVYGSRTAEGLRAALVQANTHGGQAANLEFVFDWEIADDSDHYPFIAAGIPTVMFHTGLHDQYHRPSDDAHLVNVAGIEPVARLALDFVTAIADEPGPPRAFRPRCRQETAATRRTLEQPADAGNTPRGRWGMSTRGDPAEPSGPVVVRVEPNSPVATAGLALGDRIVAIDGRSVADQADMVSRLAAAGESVVVDVDRRGRIVQLRAVTTADDKRPD